MSPYKKEIYPGESSSLEIFQNSLDCLLNFMKSSINSIKRRPFFSCGRFIKFHYFLTIKYVYGAFFENYVGK